MRKIDLTFGLLALMLAACAQTGPYRYTDAANTRPSDICDIDVSAAAGDLGAAASAREVTQCPKANHVRVRAQEPIYQVSYVEIDDQGLMASRSQAEAALGFVQTRAATSKVRGTYVVVFVHGWHHNAKAGDAHVEGFHRALAALSGWQPDFDVRGVYIGWRGDSLAIPGLRYLSFWDRKNTSDEVGRGGIYEFLTRLEMSVKDHPGGQANRLVLIGHSFGASVAFNALAQLHIHRFLEGVHRPGNGRRFHGYGDLTVLVNPAIEGMRYMPFQSALYYYTDPRLYKGTPADFSKEDKPALLIVSSEGDWATHTTFPFARFFTTFLEAHRTVSYLGEPAEGLPNYQEWNMDRDTLGNHEQFNSHVLIVRDPAVPDPAKNCRRIPASLLVKPGKITFPDSGIELKRIDGKERNPYWHAAISADIIPDHSRISGLRFMCWLNQLADAGP